MNDLQIYFDCNTLRLYLELIEKLGKIHARRDLLPSSVDNNLHSTSEMTEHPTSKIRTTWGERGMITKKTVQVLPAIARTAVELAFSIV